MSSTAAPGPAATAPTGGAKPGAERMLTFGAANDPHADGAPGNTAVGYAGMPSLSGAGNLDNLAGVASFRGSGDMSRGVEDDGAARQSNLAALIGQYVGRLLAQLLSRSGQGSSGGETTGAASPPLPAATLSCSGGDACPAAAESGGAVGQIGAGAATTRASEKNVSIAPTDENLRGRPPGDNRSADQIINENDVLKNLGNQKDIKVDQLKARFGDWTAGNKDAESRADAAYNMAKVLNSIKALRNREDGDRGKVHTNGKIEGITKSGDARHGTEAGVLKDIAEQGLSALPQNGQLPDTKDTHVRLDGTNKDNFQWAMGRIGDFLSHIPILKSIAAPFFNNIGEARNLGEVFSGGLKGLAQGALSVSRGPVGWAMTAVTDTAQIVVEEVADEKKKKAQS
ncbi:hypothetical protein [Acerihabitans arboris]|uniref:hypothetical protein n=1 Tax=Acerihabitans arboris TaxID=2691583 RepID=UPI0015B414D8|nr:hypothetical protein [Acerihabitans arboris]